MFAFVNAALPVRPFSSSLSPATSVKPTAAAPAKWTMRKSPSVPFVDAVEGLADLPAGSAEFDPLGLSTSLPISWMQEAEIKHGRICMLAFLGALVQEAYTFPWYKNAPTLFTLGHDYGAHNGSLSQVLLWTSFFEIMTLPAVIQMVRGKSDRKPGNFGLDIFGMMAKDPIMMQKEIKNGRLAMLAISGVLTTEVLTGQGIIAQLASGNVVPKF